VTQVKMDHKERVLAAINHQEPDRVPRGEIQIDYLFADKILGSQTFKEKENAFLRWSTESLSTILSQKFDRTW